MCIVRNSQDVCALPTGSAARHYDDLSATPPLTPRPKVDIFLTAPVGRQWQTFPHDKRDRARGLELHAWEHAKVPLTPSECRELARLKALRKLHLEGGTVTRAERALQRTKADATAPLMGPLFATELQRRADYHRACQRAYAAAAHAHAAVAL